MSKRNSPEAKAERRQKYLAKQNRFSNPVAKPEQDFIHHYGFIPNDPYFENAAVAINQPDAKAAFRTKQQLQEYFDTGNVDELLCTRSGKGVVYISMFKSNPKWSATRKKMDTEDTEGTRCFYLVRHTKDFCAVMGGDKIDKKKWESKNPFYYSLNTYMVQKEHIKDLPDCEPTNEQIIQIGKRDEEVQPLTEAELDEYLASAKECNLRKWYEHNEDGLIIDEFPSPKGEVYFQPRKTDECWLNCTHFIPTIFTPTSIVMPRIETGNIYTGDWD